MYKKYYILIFFDTLKHMHIQKKLSPISWSTESCYLLSSVFALVPDLNVEKKDKKFLEHNF